MQVVLTWSLKYFLGLVRNKTLSTLIEFFHIILSPFKYLMSRSSMYMMFSKFF